MSNVITTGKENKGSFIRKYFEKLAGNKLSKRFKRLIYISSILGIIQQVRDPDMVLVHRLNDVFKIAKYPDSFVFPMYIKSLIWTDITSGNIELCSRSIKVTDISGTQLSYVDCDTIGMYFAEHTPQWLRYDSDDAMSHDVKTLLTNLMTYKAA